LNQILSKGIVMKKMIIVATAALCFAGNLSAVETAGGAAATTTAVGTITAPVIVATTVVLGVGTAVVANNRGSTTQVEPPPGPGPGPGPVDPTCNGSDPLVDGVCTGTTTTVTVSGTGTTTVPVTFTYLPTT
jgi:hypothetical protein